MKKIILCLIGLILWGLLWSCSNADSSNSEATNRVPVEVVVIQLGDVRQSLSYNGDIHAKLDVKVFSKIPDRIERFFVDEGDRVTKGQPIARIVATTVEQGVKQAEAALVAARAQEANLQVEFERAKRLFNENAMSRQQYDAIQTQFEAAQAQATQAAAALNSIQSQLQDATVSASISGIIGKRYYESGDMANPATPLVSIVQMDRVKIVFNATEEDLGKLVVGQDAYVRVRSYPDRQFPGKVSRISPVLDALTRMATLEVLLDNPDYLLKPGMYAEVEVVTGIIDEVMVVPRFSAIESTVMERIDGQDQVVKNFYVYTIENGTAKQNKLNVRYVNHKSIAVDGGISVGDTLVVAGQNSLRDGVPVIVTGKGGIVL
jgi:RND family efflux transporter MFP subunit